MKINGQQFTQVKNTSGSSPRSSRVSEEGRVSDSFQAGSTSSTRSASRPESAREQAPVYRQTLRHGAAAASIATAGLAGLAGSVAVADLHYPDGRWDLKAIADRALSDNGLATEYPPEVLKQVADIKGPAVSTDPWVKDLRHLPFSSIDNKTSQDLDQLEYAEKLPNGDIKVLVAVTDVDSLVPKDSPLDKHAMSQTTSVYTPDKIYNLLPEKLSCDLISLNQGQDRLAFVVEYTVKPDGSLKDESVYQGMVNSQAKLDYPTVGDWLDGKTDIPNQVGQAGAAMIDQIEVQHEAAQRLKEFRTQHGALEFEGGEAKIHVENGSATGVEGVEKNSATELVENFMVTSNQVMSRFLHAHGMPSIERVVAKPEKWDKIVDLAAQHGGELPSNPNGVALSDWLARMKNQDPDNYGTLSGQVIRLIGRGEFQAVGPNDPMPGHFCLAVSNYAQCTAEMRRAGDIANGRMAKAALAGKPCPYSEKELSDIAMRLSEGEQDAKKAERSAEKSAIATMLENRIGERFQAVVSGKNAKGVWVKISSPPVEGFLQGGGQLNEGKKISVILTSVNVEKGKIDFRRA